MTDIGNPHLLLVHTRKVYKLGEGLRVRVLDADRLMRTIDFKIVNQGGAGDGEE